MTLSQGRKEVMEGRENDKERKKERKKETEKNNSLKVWNSSNRMVPYITIFISFYMSFTVIISPLCF